jgi:hypothetical protein
MPPPKTSGRDCKPRDRKSRNCKPGNSKSRKLPAGATTESDAAAASLAASSQAQAGNAPAEITVESLVRDLGEVLKIAIENERPTAAVAAATAIGRLLDMLPDKPGRPPSRNKPGRGGSPAPPAKFDGNYHDAARRVAFLLGIGKEKKAGAPDKAGEADGQ